MKTVDFNIADLTILPELQMRAGSMNMELVEEMRRTLKKKAAGLPPIRVAEVAGIGLCLTDGFKRFKAHQLENKVKIRGVNLGKCSYLDAVADAMSANKEQRAEPTTSADKRRAIQQLTNELACSGQAWSNKKMAEHVGCSDDLVATVLKEHSSNNQQSKARVEEPKKEGLDGKKRGPRRQAPKADTSKPTPRSFPAYTGPTGALPTSTPYQYEPQIVNPDADDPPELAKPKPEAAKTKVGSEKGVDWRTFETVKRWMAQLPDHIQKWHPGKISDYEIADLNASADEYARNVSALQKKLTGKS